MTAPLLVTADAPAPVEPAGAGAPAGPAAPAAPAARRSGVVARLLQALVRAYQLLARGRPSPCRYDPSCSSYAHEALAVHGALRGSWLTVRRLGRCHPWGGTGWDPVPPRKAN